MTAWNRRRVLRGVVGGSAVTVGLPLLNCFLNGNGDALADGKPMPIRFGTWFWGLGMNASVFVPKKTGTDFEFPEEIEALAPLRDKINILTNATAFRDNSPVQCHITGWAVSRTGVAPAARILGGESYDIKIANSISRTRRFKSLTLNAAADARVSYSYEDPNTPSPADYSPVLFYSRLFGPDFPNPNAKDFKPSPRIMARKSVLSGVMGEMDTLNKKVGADDRQRLDQYFSGLRHLEQQFDQQLSKPEPIAACAPGKAPTDADMKMGNESDLVIHRHKMMSDLLAMAIACDQTRVFNMAYAAAFSNTTKAGYEKPHHTTTHEEPVDEKLGYQPTVSWFTRRCMDGFAYFIQAFANIKEGNGTLLDNMLIIADTDHGLARMHALDGMPALTAGRAGGKVKTGYHVDMKGTTLCRVGYTAMNVMGVEAKSFGDRSNTNSNAISEILV
ncbi:MAG: DUF1552 domain-containing protein [Gammaproteobacteria bacterium]|nr:DUF1552 domain-containing protein [Gammaproteobacteria bacterium]